MHISTILPLERCSCALTAYQTSGTSSDKPHGAFSIRWNMGEDDSVAKVWKYDPIRDVLEGGSVFVIRRTRSE